MKQQQPFGRECKTFCIKDRVVVRMFFNFERETALKDSTF